MARSNHTLRIGNLRQTSGGRAIVTALVLFAFVLQSFVVQTHVHLAPAGSAAAIRTANAPSAFKHAKNTGDNDASQCPWCQAVLASGSYIAPAAPPIHAPLVVGVVDPIAPSAVVAASVAARAWQSRAPPVG